MWSTTGRAAPDAPSMGCPHFQGGAGPDGGEVLASFATKPIYVFGGFGLFSFACAVAAFLIALYYKLAGLKSFVQTPLPLVTVMFTWSARSAS